jgi:hypothetical protein
MRHELGRERIESQRGCCAELTKAELDMAILGQLAALVYYGQSAVGCILRTQHGPPLVQSSILSAKKSAGVLFCSCMEHYITNGFCPHTHGNTGRSSSHAITLTDARYATKFSL